MKLKKYSRLICGVAVSALFAACGGGNNVGDLSKTTTSQQLLTPIAEQNSTGKSLKVSGVTANLHSIAKGNGVYVAVGDSGTILTSADGSKWNSVSSGVTVNLHSIAYHKYKSLFYAVGDNSTVLSSSDGITWTQYKSLNPPEDLYSILSIKNHLVIGAESSTVYEIDTDARNVVSFWTNIVDNTKLVSSTYGKGMMALGGRDGSILYKSESDWSSAWTRVAKFSGMSINALSYESADKWFLAGTSTGKVIQAESINAWNLPVPASDSSINSIILDAQSNYFLAVGGSSGNSMMVISNDYNDWNKQVLPVSNVQLNDVKCFDNNDCFIVGDNGTILSGLNRDSSSKLPIWKQSGVDEVPPTVLLNTPENGARDISITPTIQIQFSEPVYNVSTSNVSLHVNSPTGPAVALDSVLGNEDNLYTINPSNPLSEDTEYYVVIGNGITDIGGNALLATNFAFTTGDFTAPSVTSFTPMNGAVNQSTSPGIVFTLSELISQELLTPSNIILRTKAGAVVSGYSISYNPDTKTVTVNLNGNVLIENTTYQLVLNQVNIKDNGGNQLGTNANYVLTTFTTGEFNAPVLSSIIPANGASSFSPGSRIVLNFSEPMNTSTVNTTSIKLKKNYNGSYVNLIYPIFSDDKQTASFAVESPSSLTNESSFSIIMNESMVKDSSGKAVGTNAAKVVSNFMGSPASLTVDGSPLIITGAKVITVKMMGWQAGNVIPTAATFSFKNESGATVSTFTTTACAFPKVNSQGQSTCTSTITPTTIGNYTMTVTSGYYSVIVPVKVTTTFKTQSYYDDGHVNYGPGTSILSAVFGQKVPVDTVISFTSSAPNIIGLVSPTCTISAGSPSCSVYISGVAGSGQSTLGASFSDPSGKALTPFITSSSLTVKTSAVIPSISFGNLDSNSNDNTQFNTYVYVSSPQINSYAITLLTTNDDYNQYCYVWSGGGWSNTGTCTMGAGQTACLFTLRVEHSGANNIFGTIRASSNYKYNSATYNVTY